MTGGMLLHELLKTRRIVERLSKEPCRGSYKDIKRGVIVTLAFTALMAAQTSPQTDGSFSLLAGNGQIGFSPDGTPAMDAALNNPTAVALTPSGSFVFADQLNYLVRTVDASGNLLTIAGNGCVSGDFGSGCFSGDGGPATSASIGSVYGLAVNALGNIYISDWSNQRIREVTLTDNIINTVVGNGSAGFSGDGGLAIAASVSSPRGIAVDQSGNLFFADTGNNRVRRVDSQSGIITTIAGNGVQGYAGDQGLATNASLNAPTSVSVDETGNLFIADSGNNRVRKISPAGTITTVAGNGLARYSGDGGPAVAASLNDPLGIAADQVGTLYVADFGNKVVRKVTSGSFISSLAYAGGPSFLAPPQGPFSLATNGSGGVFISDVSRNQIAEFRPTTNTLSAAVVSSAFPEAVGLAPGILASAYGTDLASSTPGPTTLPLPLSDAGTSVTITDSMGNSAAAPLLYVSPGQVNFEVPLGVALGAANVEIASGDGTVSSEVVTIGTVAPGLFALNGAGLAAADVLVVSGSTETYQNVFTQNSSGVISANPIDLGSDGDQVYLILFGTGFRAAGTAGVTVTIGGVNATVEYAGLQGGFDGLDQVNVLVPSSLAGKGQVTIQLAANGVLANPVNVVVQ